MLGEMQNYLHRAAIGEVFGAVDSFMNNYSNGLDLEIGGKERAIGAQPRSTGRTASCHHCTAGNILIVGKVLRTVEIKPLRAGVTWSFT
jgi:hypothetical protein